MCLPFRQLPRLAGRLAGSARPALPGVFCCLCLTASGAALWGIPGLDGAWLAGCLCFLSLCTGIAATVPVARPPLRPFLTVAVAALLLVPPVVLWKIFGKVDVAAARFHMEMGMPGIRITDYADHVFAALLGVVVFLAALVVLGGAVRLAGLVHLSLACLLLMANPFLRDSFHRAYRYLVPKTFFVNLATPVPARPEAGMPDLVVVYLEGTDRRFADRDVFGDSYDVIEGLQAEALTLTSIGQMAYTGWSVAGMIASQCGIPSIDPDTNIVLDRMVCLGDVLHEAGYAAEFVVGGDAKFGGTDLFYSRHGGFRLTGLAELQAMFAPAEIEAAVLQNIADDQMVFDAALRLHDGLVRRPGPFVLVVETSGPHGVPSYLSRRCSGTGRAALTEEPGRAVRCTSEEALSFIRVLQSRQAELRPGRDLRIVLLSDHLNHAASRFPVADVWEGANTVLLLGDPAWAGRVNDRVGTMADVYPTILDWLGLARRPVAAGVGRSLLSDPPSFAEMAGLRREDLARMGDDSLQPKLLNNPYPVAPVSPSQ